MTEYTNNHRWLLWYQHNLSKNQKWTICTNHELSFILPHSEHVHHWLSITLLQSEHRQVAGRGGIGGGATVLADAGAGFPFFFGGLSVRSITSLHTNS
jgi:hypothetical protein